MHVGMQYDPIQKVKVTILWKLEILLFSNSVSSTIYNGSLQLTTDF